MTRTGGPSWTSRQEETFQEILQFEDLFSVRRVAVAPDRWLHHSWTDIPLRRGRCSA